MVEGRVGLTLLCEGIEIGANLSIGERRAVHHGDDTVDRDAALDRGPMEGLHQRLRQSEPRRLDHDMLDGRLARENGIERRHELVGDGAAEAAIGELDDVLLGASLVSTAFEDLAIDADIAELVDDHREPAAARIGEHVADERRLARAEKARDDGAGNAGERGHRPSWSSAASDSGRITPASGGPRD